MKMPLKSFLNKHIGYYIVGLAILALGIRFIISSDLGAAPWDLLTLGLSKKTHISIGSWQILCNIFMILVTKIVFRKPWNFVCLIPGILLGFFLDGIALVMHFDAFPPIVSLLIGCILCGLGLAIYMNQGFSANAIDNFTYTLYTSTKWNSGVCKVIGDAIALIVMLILGIMIPMMTILIYFLVPFWMQFFYKILRPRDLFMKPAPVLYNE